MPLRGFLLSGLWASQYSYERNSPPHALTDRVHESPSNLQDIANRTHGCIASLPKVLTENDLPRTKMPLTSHMKARLAFLYTHLTSRTWFSVGLDPFLRQSVARIAVIAHIIELFACQTFVPWHLVGEAHFVVAFFTGGVWVSWWCLVQLSCFAEGTETPAEVGIVGQEGL